MNELELLASKGLCELLMPKVAWSEAEKGTDILRKEKAWSYYFIGLTGTNSQQYWFKRIENIVFPSGANNQNQINDVWILVTTREMGYPIVTNDGDSKSQSGGMLGNKDQLKALGIKVLRDFEAVKLVKNNLQTFRNHSAALLEL